MRALKWYCLAASLALTGAALAADPPPRFSSTRALSASAPEPVAPNFEGGLSLINVTVGGTVEVLD